MKLGFIGCGTIAAAMVTGLSARPDADPIVVSPRNAEIAAGLARRFGNVRVAASNQAVVDACDVVVVSVRPDVARSVLAGLRFRAGQRVVSLVATMRLDQVRALVAPASHVVRAVPLPAVAYASGPTALYPPDCVARKLFDELGAAVELEAEDEFDTFTVVTAMMASYFEFAGTVSRWMAARGTDELGAHAYTAMMLRGLAGASDVAPDSSFAELAEEHQTRGGLNEQVVRQLRRRGVFTEVERAMDAVLERLRDARKAA